MPEAKKYNPPNYKLEQGQKRVYINDQGVTYEILYVGSSNSFVIIKGGSSDKIETTFTNLWLVNNTRVQEPKIQRSPAQIPNAWINISDQGTIATYPYLSGQIADGKARPSRVARVNIRTGETVWCKGREIIPRDQLEVIAICEWEDEYGSDDEDDD